jgi:hypothetical protein
LNAIIVDSFVWFCHKMLPNTEGIEGADDVHSVAQEAFVKYDFS